MLLSTDDYLYWTDWQQRTIERVNKRNGGERIYVAREKADIMDLIVVDVHRSYQGTNPCADDNNGCQELCLHRPERSGGVTCACEMLKELQMDGSSCVVPNGFLLFSESKNIRWSSLNNSMNDQVIPLNGVHQAQVLDYDVDDSRVYWADSGIKEQMFTQVRQI